MNNLILIHGALANAYQMQPLHDALKANYKVSVFQFPFHGKDETMDADNFWMDYFARQLYDFTAVNQLKGSLVFGYSMGGYAALSAESFHPGTFSRIITLGTKFNWTKESAEAETKRLNPEIMQQKIPVYVEQLRIIFGSNWAEVVKCTAQLMQALGENKILFPEVLKKIKCPVTILRGEHDKMVTREESLESVSHLYQAHYQELKNTGHPFEQAELKSLIRQIENADARL